MDSWHGAESGTQRNPLSSAYTDPASAGFFFLDSREQYAAAENQACVAMRGLWADADRCRRGNGDARNPGANHLRRLPRGDTRQCDADVTCLVLNGHCAEGRPPRLDSPRQSIRESIMKGGPDCKDATPRAAGFESKVNGAAGRQTGAMAKSSRIRTSSLASAFMSFG